MDYCAKLHPVKVQNSQKCQFGANFQQDPKLFNYFENFILRSGQNILDLNFILSSQTCQFLVKKISMEPKVSGFKWSKI